MVWPAILRRLSNAAGTARHRSRGLRNMQAITNRSARELEQHMPLTTAMSSPTDGDVWSLAALLSASLGEVRFPLAPADYAGLREQVRAYVDTTKRLGWPPERIIVEVKQLAADAGLGSSWRRSQTARSAVGVDSLRVELVNWCIHCFYASDDGARR